MNRTEFIVSLPLLNSLLHMESNSPKPELFHFADDGQIPNSRYPLLLYRNVFSARGTAGAAWLEQRFAANNWTNSWRNGIFSYLHYHSSSHEVLGIYSGSATVQVGGSKGKAVSVQAGDVIVIPAGVGHQNLGSSADFGVVGAYPDGRTFDVLRGQPGERPKADQAIAALPIPTTDPLLGPSAGLVTTWT
jgi:uncharacterized protein YjlB